MSSTSISNEHEQDTLVSKMSNLSIPKSQSIDHLAFSSSHDSSPCCSSDLICKTPSATTSTEKTFTTSTSSSTDTSTSTSTSTSSPSFPPLSLAELVHTVQSELQGRGDMSHVRAAMKAYDESRNEWKRYEFYDSQKKYTRNLIATDYTTYTLMLLCWNPERGSPVHDHAGSECFMRVIMGNVKETQYHWAEKIDEHLKIKEENILKPGDVAYINDSIGLHKVENTFTQPAVTLHLYMPPYESCQLFMDETGKATESFVTFYSENGEIVEHS